MRGLPEGWVEVELGEVIEPKETRNPRTDGSKSFRYIDVQAVDNDRNRVGVAQEVASKRAPSRARRLVRKDDILFCLVRPYLKNVAQVPPELDGQVASTAFCVLRPHGSVVPRFLFHQVSRDSFIAEVPTYGTSPPSAREDEFLKQRIPLAPLPEQHRIVAKIESLFAKLDEGVAALKRAEANLERYRASVLKAAVEGRLTKQWRRENPPEETGEELLERILVERRMRWETEQLAKFEAKGRKPPRNWKAKYKEPVTPDTSRLPGLPEGWCWSSLEALCDIQLGKMLSRSAREGTQNRRPYLRNSNVRWFSIDQRDLKSMSFKDSELHRYAVRRGDLLVCEGGEPGRCSVFQGPDGVLMYQKALHRARPHVTDVSTMFLQYCIAHQVAHGIGMPRYSETTIRHLTLEKIKAVPLPLPPAVEQQRIVRTAEQHLVRLVSDCGEKTITAALHRATALRQSILKRAFEGRLVPHDPADEPSVLFERIRAERDSERNQIGRQPTTPNRELGSQAP